VHEDEWGFGGEAPNKLKACAEGKGSERASDPCRRHGHKLVPYLSPTDCLRKEELQRNLMSADISGRGQCYVSVYKQFLYVFCFYICFAYVLYMFYVCFVYVLYIFCICFVYVLYIFYICFVYVLCMFLYIFTCFFMFFYIFLYVFLYVFTCFFMFFYMFLHVFICFFICFYMFFCIFFYIVFFYTTSKNSNRIRHI